MPNVEKCEVEVQALGDGRCSKVFNRIAWQALEVPSADANVCATRALSSHFQSESGGISCCDDSRPLGLCAKASIVVLVHPLWVFAVLSRAPPQVRGKIFDRLRDDGKAQAKGRILLGIDWASLVLGRRLECGNHSSVP